MIHILQYRYPFQKPWLLILSISTGFIIVLITLQLLLAGLRRLRTAKKT